MKKQLILNLSATDLDRLQAISVRFNGSNEDTIVSLLNLYDSILEIVAAKKQEKSKGRK
jgi:hypothetical protein